MPLNPTYTALLVVLSNGSEAYELNVTATILQEAFVTNPIATLNVGSSPTQTLSCGVCNSSNFNVSGYNWPACSLCFGTTLISPSIDGAMLWYTFRGTVSGTTFTAPSNYTLFNYTAAFLSTFSVIPLLN